MNVIMPSPGSGLPVILDAIRRAFINAMSPNEAVPYIMLRSPNGKVFKVVVNETGTLRTEAVDGNARA